MSAPGPRLRPGRREEIGTLNALICAALGRAAGGGAAPHLFTTLARHRRLFRAWLRFAGRLMPGGVLPRVDTELAILRVAHRRGCEYEWGHHVRLGQAAGLTPDDIERVRSEAATEGWTARQALLLEAVDALDAEGTLDGELWARLSDAFSEVELIELVLLVGHYEMLATTIAALGIEPDGP